MTKTRKRAREDAAQDVHDNGASSQIPDNTNTTLPVVVPDDIDLDYLSELLPNIPDPSRVSPDAVAALYKLVLGLSADMDGLRREVDELNSEVGRKDVELDQALQDKESLSKDLEESVESVHSELEQVKSERERLGSLPPLFIHTFEPIHSYNCPFSFLVQWRRVMPSKRKYLRCRTPRLRQALRSMR